MARPQIGGHVVLAFPRRYVVVPTIEVAARLRTVVWSLLLSCVCDGVRRTRLAAGLLTEVNDVAFFGVVVEEVGRGESCGGSGAHRGEWEGVARHACGG